MTSKEAFNRLKFIADKELNTGSKSYKDLQEFWNYKEPLKVITDLVERDTPKKPEKDKDGDDVCPTCGLGFIVAHYDLASVLHDFCPDCGQRLDWS